MEKNSKRQASTAFTSAEKAVSTRQIGSCLDPIDGMDFEEQKISCNY
jgi:hypothetical protein